MNSKSNDLGSFLGIAIVIVVAGWFGVNHYYDSRDERIPIKVKQVLARLQNTLPIEVRPGIMLEQFNVTRSSVDFTIKIYNTKSLSRDRSIMRERLEHNSLVWICKWREQHIGKTNIKFTLRIISKDNIEIASVENVDADCDVPIPSIPDKLAS